MTFPSVSPLSSGTIASLIRSFEEPDKYELVVNLRTARAPG
jgi:hypothetical protein